MELPFGVSIPDETIAAASTEAPAATEQKPEGTELSAQAPEARPSENPEAKEPPSLDSFERVRYNGRELTRDELTELLQTAESAKSEEKYASNYDADLRYVAENPDQWERFKETYPAKYVQAAKDALQRAGIDVEPKPSDEVEQLVKALESHPRFQKLFGVVKEAEAQKEEARMQKLDAHLTSLYDKFSKKYPEAAKGPWKKLVDAEVHVTAIALEREGKGRVVDDKMIEKIFRTLHEEAKKSHTTTVRKAIHAQKTANSDALDMGGGGSVAIPAPHQPRTLKEAKAAALRAAEGAA